MKRILLNKSFNCIVRRPAHLQQFACLKKPYSIYNTQARFFSIPNPNDSKDPKEGWSPVASDESEAATISQTKEYMKAAKEDV